MQDWGAPTGSLPVAANAVLHARTDFDVAVSALHDRSGVRVTVRDDASALPAVTAPSATAMSGRGLALVQTLASRWGAGPSSSARKGVWFELDLATSTGDASAESGTLPGGGGAAVSAESEPEPSVEELLAAWSDGEQLTPRPGAGGEVEVVLPPLDAADLLAAKESMDDLLRELQLVLLAPQELSTGDGARADGVAVARRLDAAARRFDVVRRQVRQQVGLAAASGQAVVSLRLLLPAGTQAAAVEYQAAVEAAESLAEHGDLLSSGARLLRRHRAVRRAYLGEVIAAAGA